MKIYLAGKEYKGVLERRKYLLGVRYRLASFYNLEINRMLEELINENLLGRYDSKRIFKI